MKNKFNHEAWVFRTSQNNRLEIIRLLGGKCRCGFSDLRAIQIDHVAGGGSQKDGTKEATGYNRYLNTLRAIQNGSRDYQLLCANCNAIKIWENNELNRTARQDTSRTFI